MGSIDFNQLYTNYYNRLHYIAFSYTNDRYLAEDIVQETFIKAYRKIDTIVDTSKISAWLSAITTRTAIDFLRMEKRKSSRMISDSEMVLDLYIPDTSTEDELDIMLLKEEISESMKKLSDESHAVLDLKINFGLNEKEISNRLNLKQSTVKTRLYRARKQLKHAVTFSETA